MAGADLALIHIYLNDIRVKTDYNFDFFKDEGTYFLSLGPEVIKRSKEIEDIKDWLNGFMWGVSAIEKRMDKNR